MLKLAICDDIEEDRNVLLNLIKGMCHNKDLDSDFEISLFSSGEDLENHYEDGKSPFDIVFLDIFMTRKNGIETARQIRKNDSMCKIIFITSSTSHALDGYSVFAYNYLVKPISPKAFTSVFKKAVEEAYTERRRAVCVKTESKIQVIQYKDIKYIESQGKIIKIYTKNGEEIACYLKLDEIESMLAEPRFLRSHKSFLVNMDYVATAEEYSFTLVDNTNVPIRQKGFAGIKKKYYEFILKKLD